MKIILFFAFVIGVFPAVSQKRIIRKAPPIVNDSIYIGVANNIILRDISNLQGVKSDDASVYLKKDTLVLLPRRPGNLLVTLILKDSILKRRYTAIYLPHPSN